ncbi:MAG: lamin tail domain-containing protein, partial [bacterium]
MKSKTVGIIFGIIFSIFLSKEVIAQPTITSINPNIGINSGTMSVTIRGSNFQSGATVTLTQASTSIIGTSTFIESGTITAVVDLKNVQIGSWTVFVTNPGGQTGTLTDGFRVIPQLLITEVYYDPVDELQEFVEIRNNTPYLIDLSGYYLSDIEGTHTFPANSVLLPYGTMTVAQRGTVCCAAFGKNPDFELNNTDSNIPDVTKITGWTIELANGGDEVILSDNFKTVIDVVVYGGGSYPGVTAHSGVTEGNSLHRQPPHQDTNDCSVDFQGGSPTPTTQRTNINLKINKYKYPAGDASIGERITYHIYYENPDATTIYNANITDLLPDEVDYSGSTDTTGVSPTVSGKKITWEIETLSTGINKIILYGTLTITAMGSRTFLNLASITTNLLCYDEQDWNDNYASCSTHITSPVSNLWIKKIGTENIPTGNLIEYQITYGNKGSYTVGSVTITDLLPDGVSYSSDTSSLSGTISDNKITWFIGTLSAGASGTFTLYGTVSTLGSNTIVNIASITGTCYFEQDESDNVATCSTHIQGIAADLWIKKIGTDNIMPKKRITYTITYGNNENYKVGSVSITDLLPDGLIYCDDDCAFTKSISGNKIKWLIGTLSAREAGTITLYGSVTALGSITIINSASITSACYPESNFSNNMATCTTHIVAPPGNLWISKYSSVSEILPEQVIKYDIYYKNKGSYTVGSVTITDLLPDGIIYRSDNSGLPVTISGNKITWFVGTLSPEGGSYDFQLYGTVTAFGSMTLINMASITGVCYIEQDESDNFATASIHVTSPPGNLWIEKIGPGSITTQDVIEYQIKYGNKGTYTVGSVTITDILPDGVNYGTDTSGLLIGTCGSNFITWFVGTLSPGVSATFTLYGTVTAAGSKTIINIATITGTCYVENDNSDNLATCSTHVKGTLTDLWIMKEVLGSVTTAEAIAYKITYGNNGSFTVGSVSITDLLPDGVSYSYDNSSFSKNISGNEIIWSIATLAPEERGSFTLYGTVTALGSTTIINIASITSLCYPDKNWANNIATCSTHISGTQTNLWVKKYAPANVIAGERITYDIWYGNYDKVGVRNVKIIDELPEGTSYSSDDSGLQTNISGNKITWFIGTLSGQVSRTFYLYATVTTFNSVKIVNSATITGECYIEKDLSDNVTRGTTTVFVGKISITPTAGTVGSIITVLGSEFSATEGILISLGNTLSIAVVTTNASGTFTTTFTIDTQPYGTYTVKAIGLTSNLKAIDLCRVLPNIILVTPTQGTVGSFVTVRGNGFGGSKTIRVDFGRRVDIQQTSSDVAGRW